MENEKHTIWQDAIYEDESQWRDAYEEELNVNEQNGTESPHKSLSEFIADSVDSQLDDERENLDIEVPNGIIVIGDLGLWDGHRTGYLNEDLHNVRDCLHGHVSGLSYLKFYVDGTDLKCEEAHHDGTNVYTFREWKDGVTDQQKSNLKLALYSNNRDASAELIERYTESLRPRVAKVYGW